jgi:hypothetical protein
MLQIYKNAPNNTIGSFAQENHFKMIVTTGVQKKGDDLIGHPLINYIQVIIN